MTQFEEIKAKLPTLKEDPLLVALFLLKCRDYYEKAGASSRIG